jgi:lysozyme family protein
MSSANFAACLAVVLRSEGGFNPNDGAGVGATQMGITQRTLSAWLGHPAGASDVKALTLETVTQIYREDYWAVVRGDMIPAGLDLMIFDEAVNQGPGRAIRTMQSALGTMVDGLVGPLTLDALAHCNPELMIDRVVAMRAALYHKAGLWPQYGAAWMHRLYSTAGQAHAMTRAGTVVLEPSPPIAPAVDPGPVPLAPASVNHALPLPTSSVVIPPVILPAPPAKTPVVAIGAGVAGTVVAAGAVVIGTHQVAAIDLKPLIDLAFQIVDGTIITVIVPWLAYRVLQWLGIKKDSAIATQVLTATENGAALALSKANEYADAHGTVMPKSAIVATALNYAKTAVPDAVTKAGLTTPAGQEHLANIVEAQLQKLTIGKTP